MNNIVIFIVMTLLACDIYQKGEFKYFKRVKILHILGSSELEIRTAQLGTGSGWGRVNFPSNSPYIAVLCTCSFNSIVITPAFCLLLGNIGTTSGHPPLPPTPIPYEPAGWGWSWGSGYGNGS